MMRLLSKKLPEISVVLYFKLKLFFNNLNLGHVNSGMFCERTLSSVSFAAFVAPERLLPSVCPHVALQLITCSASVVALVTLVWLFSCMVSHHVIFQLTSLNTGILAA